MELLHGEPAGPRSLPAKASLFYEVVATYLRARAALKRADLPTVLTGLRGAPPPEEPGYITARAQLEALRLAGAAVRTLSVLPADSRCLMRSLVLTGMLAKRGVGSTLVIGVKPGEAFGAHAWVEVGGRALLPTDEDSFGRLVEL